MHRFVVCQKIQFLAQQKVHQSWLQYDKTHFEEVLFSAFDIHRPPSVHGAVVKRKSEFLAGRLAAKKLLEQFGHADHQVRVGDNRSPVWPEGIIGSISHTEREAICLMATEQEQAYLGVDIENWLTAQTASEIGASIVNEAEARYLQQLDWPFHRALTTVFSAKESLFKALYPSVGSYFGFEAAELTALDTQSHTFTLTLAEELEGHICARQQVFHGTFIPNQHSVVTYIVS